MNIKDLLQLAGKQGKVVIVSETGEVKGVFVDYAEYQRLSFGKTAAEPAADPERINREILEAQLKDNMDLNNNLETLAGDMKLKMPEPIGKALQQRAQSLFVSQPAPDINYGPRVSIEAEEEIKPNFDDI